MKARAQIVQVLGAAIVLIAALFLPSSAAQAHAGHAHNVPAVHAAAEASLPASAAAEAEREAPAGLRAGQLSMLALVLPEVPVSAAGCSGGCCSTGAACCGAAVMADEASLGAMRARAARAAPLPDGHRAGTDPEALPEPPRSFA